VAMRQMTRRKITSASPSTPAMASFRFVAPANHHFGESILVVERLESESQSTLAVRLAAEVRRVGSPCQWVVGIAKGTEVRSDLLDLLSRVAEKDATAAMVFADWMQTAPDGAATIHAAPAYSRQVVATPELAGPLVAFRAPLLLALSASALQTVPFPDTGWPDNFRCRRIAEVFSRTSARHNSFLATAIQHGNEVGPGDTEANAVVIAIWAFVVAVAEDAPASAVSHQIVSAFADATVTHVFVVDSSAAETGAVLHELASALATFVPTSGIASPATLECAEARVAAAPQHADRLLGVERYVDGFRARVHQAGSTNVAHDVSAVTIPFVISRATWEQLGGFRSAFENGCFDVDLSLRVRERGLPVIAVPSLTIRTPTRQIARPTLEYALLVDAWGPFDDRDDYFAGAIE
jgi:hypothetical protein